MRISNKLGRNKNTITAENLKIKVLQFGEGNFLRAFVDWMFYEMNCKSNFKAGVHVIQPISHGMIDKINSQDGLYNLYLNGIRNGDFVTDHMLIDVIQKGINPYQNFDDYLSEAVNPDLRFIISNTTEAGIQFNSEDNFEDEPASSFPGKLTQLLYKRFEELPDSERIIVLPCELIDKNGDQLRRAIFQYIMYWNLEDTFYQWINEKVIFCNTLVDRIVPGYPSKNIEEFWSKLGQRDELIVEGELFHLWVIEGPEWVKSQLPFEESNLNVIFTDDLSYYRTRKVRILNGAHTAMVPVAYLYGIDFVKDAIENELVGDFIQRVVFDEIVPTIQGDRNELKDYAQEIINRFKNPSIEHELLSISLNSFSKFKTRVLPSILSYHKQKNSLPKFLTVSFASMLCFYKGVRLDKIIPLKDDETVITLMSDLWKNHNGTPEGTRALVRTVLSQKELWSTNLTHINGLVEAITDNVNTIQTIGIGKLLRDIMRS